MHYTGKDTVTVHHPKFTQGMRQCPLPYHRRFTHIDPLPYQTYTGQKTVTLHHPIFTQSRTHISSTIPELHRAEYSE
jgi:hypothetical protein